MKTNLRGKIRDFMASEEGRVGVKGPLTLGMATGSILLAQAIFGIQDAAAQPCDDDEDCKNWPNLCHPDGTCVSG
ncbi:MAG: hypothetical protein OXN25_07190 [Candidatus Poribacteria bacterium]|nr:hypothetical protein [Candidatus Poribacteria bacterium]